MNTVNKANFASMACVSNAVILKIVLRGKPVTPAAVRPLKTIAKRTKTAQTARPAKITAASLARLMLIAARVESAAKGVA
jgi:hypothetical protein